MRRVHFYTASASDGAWKRATQEPTDLSRIAALEEWDYRTGQRVVEHLLSVGHYVGGDPEHGFWMVEAAGHEQ
jgi:hypothetical protein